MLVRIHSGNTVSTSAPETFLAFTGSYTSRRVAACGILVASTTIHLTRVDEFTRL